MMKAITLRFESNVFVFACLLSFAVLFATATEAATVSNSATAVVKVLPAVDVAAIDRERILKVAAASLDMQPVTITKFRAKFSDGGSNDFYSNGDYWWPNPKT